MKRRTAWIFGGLLASLWGGLPAQAGVEPGVSERVAALRPTKEQNRTRTGFDHLWILAKELRALRPPRAEIGAEWEAPARLARRIARFHLVDDVRGEPPHYRPREIRRATLRCRLTAAQPGSFAIALTGRFTLDARRDRSYPRHFDGSLQGRLVYDRRAKRFTRLDLYAEGDASGEGRWTPGAPEGTYRLAVAFELPPDDFATAVPPQGMRSSRGYLKP